mgnify:CR=1 FL=1
MSIEHSNDITQHGYPPFAAPSCSATSDVRLLREDKVWHVWIDGEHVCECCDFTFNAAVDRLKARLSPNAKLKHGND